MPAIDIQQKQSLPRLRTSRATLRIKSHKASARQILGKLWWAWIAAYIALCGVSLAVTVALIKTFTET
jgi:hypothetical protein